MWDINLIMKSYQNLLWNTYLTFRLLLNKSEILYLFWKVRKYSHEMKWSREHVCIWGANAFAFCSLNLPANDIWKRSNKCMYSTTQIFIQNRDQGLTCLPTRDEMGRLFFRPARPVEFSAGSVESLGPTRAEFRARKIINDEH